MLKGQLQQDKTLDFITAGNAVITLKSLKTQKHFTYKISLMENGNFWVGVVTSSDNTVFAPLMSIKFVDGIPNLMGLAKSWISKDAPSFIAFEYVFWKLCTRQHIDNLEIWHEGRCCRCGRTLTVPESVEFGIGPECLKKEQRISL